MKEKASLIQRLRDVATSLRRYSYYSSPDLMDEAADLLTKYEKDIARLEQKEPRPKNPEWFDLCGNCGKHHGPGTTCGQATEEKTNDAT